MEEYLDEYEKWVKRALMGTGLMFITLLGVYGIIKLLKNLRKVV